MYLEQFAESDAIATICWPISGRKNDFTGQGAHPASGHILHADPTNPDIQYVIYLTDSVCLQVGIESGLFAAFRKLRTSREA